MGLEEHGVGIPLVSWKEPDDRCRLVPGRVGWNSLSQVIFLVRGRQGIAAPFLSKRQRDVVGKPTSLYLNKTQPGSPEQVNKFVPRILFTGLPR